jgi:hypothetical protein
VAESVPLGSDAFVAVDGIDGPLSDDIAFRFGPPIEPRGQPIGRFAEARPPFTAGASGLPLEVDGERFVSVTFDGQTVADASGDPVYDGPPRFDAAAPGVRSVVLAEAFEGQVVWYVGFDGPGCVSISGDPSGTTVVLTVEHPS